VEKLSSQERIIAIVEMLAVKQIEGMSNKLLAHELKSTEANVCRDLKILENRGWVEKSNGSGKWRLSPKFGGFAGQIMKCFQSAKLRLTEDEMRYVSAMQ